MIFRQNADNSSIFGEKYLEPISSRWDRQGGISWKHLIIVSYWVFLLLNHVYSNGLPYIWAATQVSDWRSSWMESMSDTAAASLGSTLICFTLFSICRVRIPVSPLGPLKECVWILERAGSGVKVCVEEAVGVCACSIDTKDLKLSEHTRAGICQATYPHSATCVHFKLLQHIRAAIGGVPEHNTTR